MKKLLLLTNLCLCTCFTFCQNNPQKSNIKETPVGSNSPSVKTQTVAPAKSGTDKGIVKDTTTKKGKGQAIVHSSPNQAKEDSIKKAKTKNKFKK